MRLLLRLLVLIGLLTSATALAPVALAAGETTPSSSGTSTAAPSASATPRVQSSVQSGGTGSQAGTSTTPTTPTTPPAPTDKPTLVAPSPASNALTSGTVTWAFTTTSTAPVTFQCKLVGGTRTGDYADCGTATKGRGTITYTGLAGAATTTYTFRVRVKAATGQPANPSVGRSWRVTPTPTTTVTTKPVANSNDDHPLLRFRATQAEPLKVTFYCQLTGPGMDPKGFTRCSGQPATAGTTVTGSQRYTLTKRGAYTFKVFAVGVAAGPAASYTWNVLDTCYTRADLCPVVTRFGDHYSPRAGGHFNNPLGVKSAQRANVDHVVRTINSMPGYAVPDPSVCRTLKTWPGTIKISLYSVTDGAFANAINAASDRCLSVQVLMNDHLTAADTPAIKRMQDALGVSVYAGNGEVRRSFAHRCHRGCRGRGVLHSKYYLFDSTLPGQRNPIVKTVMVGSSNMTGNAMKVQWNDLYTARGDAGLYNRFEGLFEQMRKDTNQSTLLDWGSASSTYQGLVWPRPASSADPTLRALQSITCTGGATGGAGINGHSAVTLNVHAWFGTRGYALAQHVRKMYDRGCYVRVLYSFMSHSVYKKLTAGTGSRMSVRRTIYSDDGDKYADLYSHFKNITASGFVGKDHSAWVTWTGSMNFTNSGVNFDEVTLRIASRSVWAQYRDRFDFISKRRSSATYATYLEPVGGGRAPDAEAKAEQRTAAAQVQSRQAILPDPSATTADGLPAD